MASGRNRPKCSLKELHKSIVTKYNPPPLKFKLKPQHQMTLNENLFDHFVQHDANDAKDQSHQIYQ